MAFDYDAIGNRVAKYVYNASGVLQKATYYMRDAQGNEMATYDYVVGAHTNTLTLMEQPIYGSSRLGMDINQADMLQTGSVVRAAGTLGNRQYELTNHLGNVLSVIKDRKVTKLNSGFFHHYEPVIVSATDYYPFGMIMPGRSYSAVSGYRFGFNGKGNDNEVEGTGNWQDYGMRMYSPRLGRFPSVDPLFGKYPSITPYAFAENDVIRSIDLDGLEKYIVEYWYNAAGGTTQIQITWHKDTDLTGAKDNNLDQDLGVWNSMGFKTKPADVLIIRHQAGLPDATTWVNSLDQNERKTKDNFYSSETNNDSHPFIFSQTLIGGGKIRGSKFAQGATYSASVSFNISVNIPFAATSALFPAGPTLPKRVTDNLDYAKKIASLFPSANINVAVEGSRGMAACAMCPTVAPFPDGSGTVYTLTGLLNTRANTVKNVLTLSPNSVLLSRIATTIIPAGKGNTNLSIGVTTR